MTKRAAVRDDAAPPARDRILAAAQDLFYRRGIRAVGVEAVVAEAGATKMSLYRAYPSKDDLVAACLQERDQRYWRSWDRTVDGAEDARRQLRALFARLVAVTTSPAFRGCPFTNAAIEFPEPDHPGRRVAEANKAELRRRLGALAEAAGARDPGLLADQLVLLFEGAYVVGQTLGADGPAAAAAAAAEALIETQLGS